MSESKFLKRSERTDECLEWIKNNIHGEMTNAQNSDCEITSGKYKNIPVCIAQNIDSSISLIPYVGGDIGLGVDIPLIITL